MTAWERVMPFNLRDLVSIPLGWRRRRTDTTLEEDLTDEDLVEIMNLREADTGVPGTIHVRTRISRPGPSVKYYAGRAGYDQPSCSIAITDPPRIVASDLPERDIPQSVFMWVARNRVALLSFWNDGASWYADEVERWRGGLQPV
jgi:hypothetical protein